MEDRFIYEQGFFLFKKRYPSLYMPQLYASNDTSLLVVQCYIRLYSENIILLTEGKIKLLFCCVHGQLLI